MKKLVLITLTLLSLAACTVKTSGSHNSDGPAPKADEILSQNLEGKVRGEVWKYKKAGFLKAKGPNNEDLLSVSIIAEDKDVCKYTAEDGDIPMVIVSVPDKVGTSTYPETIVNFMWNDQGTYVNQNASTLKAEIFKRTEDVLVLGVSAKFLNHAINGSIEAINCDPKTNDPQLPPTEDVAAEFFKNTVANWKGESDIQSPGRDGSMNINFYSLTKVGTNHKFQVGGMCCYIEGSVANCPFYTSETNGEILEVTPAGDISKTCYGQKYALGTLTKDSMEVYLSSCWDLEDGKKRNLVRFTKRTDILAVGEWNSEGTDPVSCRGFVDKK